MWTGIAIVDDTTPEETDDAELDAGRIEAALERIARRLEHDAAYGPPPAELAARLDGLIDRLRAALARSTE
jgi:hypothetical protein